MMHHDDSEALQVGPDPDKLYLYHRQQLSAMLDGELSPDQARFMLRRLQHDAELADCWERWQVCGDALRGQRNTLLPADFAQSVARAISADAGVPVAQARHAARPRLWRWGGGAALAASVAMAALFVARQPAMMPVESSPDTPAVTAAPAQAQPEPTPRQAPDQSPASLETTAVLAEAPRRSDERRSRGQSQRAAATRSQRRAETAPVAVAASDTAPRPQQAVAPATVAAEPVSAPVLVAMDPAPVVPAMADDPFATLTADSRPWPRAVLPGLGRSGHAVGYGATAMVATPSAGSFHPFEPQLEIDRAGPSMLPAPPDLLPSGSATAVGPAAVQAADEAAPAVEPR